MSETEIKEICTERMPMALKRAAEGKFTSLYDSYFDNPNREKGSNRRHWITMRPDGIIRNSIV